MLSEGTRVGPYLLVRSLGAGAFGTVWLARHIDLGTQFALKIPTDTEYVTELRKEGVITSTVRHPNIVQMQQVDTEHDPPYLAMEYVEGGSLRQRIGREGALGEREAVAILRQILEALQAAHKAGIVHRDIKPGNILLTRNGTVKVADFGIGRAHAQAVQSLLLSGSMMTRSGQSVAGTLAYMSPEQRDGQDAAPSDDLYAVGIIACELLTGNRPGARLDRFLERAGVPQQLADIIDRACEERPYRYAAAAEMLADLRDCATPQEAPGERGTVRPRGIGKAWIPAAKPTGLPSVIEGATREALGKHNRAPIGSEELRSVRDLDLGRSGVTDTDLRYLAFLTGLRKLSLRDTQVTDAGLPHLEPLKALRKLNLRGTEVTEAGVTELRSALPKCRIKAEKEALGSPAASATPSSAAPRKRAPSPVAITAAFRKALGSGDDEPISHEGLEEVRSLDFFQSSVRDTDLEQLMYFPRLEELDLTFTRITDAGLVHLRTLRSLRKLDLMGTQVTDVGMECLGGLRQLEMLDLTDTQVGDTGLADLEGLRKLWLLDLNGTQVTSKGVAALATALPQCTIRD